VTVPPQPGCTTPDGLTAATPVFQRGRFCDKSGGFYDKDSHLFNKHSRLCNKHGRLPVDPFSKTSGHANVVELVNTHAAPAKSITSPQQGGGGRGWSVPRCPTPHPPTRPMGLIHAFSIACHSPKQASRNPCACSHLPHPHPGGEGVPPWTMETGDNETRQRPSATLALCCGRTPAYFRPTMLVESG
jgi:hypothetical protein